MDAGISGTSPIQASGEGVMSPKPDTRAALVNQMTQCRSNVFKGYSCPYSNRRISKEPRSA